jgi:NAD(P)-dependent dehydrogenase (short-subunit alcohol dehydrogenase family)
LLEQRGAIVNVASTAALAAHPWAAAYSASKGGVLALTRTLAIEYAKQGLRPTPCAPAHRHADHRRVPAPGGRRRQAPVPDHVATGMADASRVRPAIAYIGSDDAIHVNGADLRIDGGTHS